MTFRARLAYLLLAVALVELGLDVMVGVAETIVAANVMQRRKEMTA